MLSKVLREEHPNKEMFDFIYNSVKVLDGDTPGLLNFHLFFMFQLSRFLGLGIATPGRENMDFYDLKNSEYVNMEPVHPYFISDEILRNWIKLSNIKIADLEDLSVDSRQRRELLEALVLYYELHILNFGSLKSLKVLHSLFGR